MTMPPKTTQILIQDQRNPNAAPMKALGVKLHDDDHRRLQEHSQKLGCFASALARTLIINGLNQLESK